MYRVILILCLLFGSALFSVGQSAKVIAENVNVRGTPTITGRIIDTVPWDTSVEILRQKGGWFLVQTSEIVGWVYGDGLRITGASTANYGTASPVRSAPGTAKPSETRGETVVVPVVVVERAVSDTPPATLANEVKLTTQPADKSEETRAAETKPETDRQATGVCKDGTLTYSTEKQGACSDHGGIDNWYADKTPTPAPSTGGTVQVRGYYRKDGTYVRPHTRRKP